MVVKIGCLMWGSYTPVLVKAAEELEDIELYLRTFIDMESPERREDLLRYFKDEADVVIIHPLMNKIWDELTAHIEKIKDTVPILCFGHDPDIYTHSSVDINHVLRVQSYFRMDGVENMKNALLYVCREFCGLDAEVPPPVEVPWQGIYHPEGGSFETLSEYLNWYGKKDVMVGILFYRSYWVNGNLKVEDALIQQLESRGIGVIPVFSYGFANLESGAWNNERVIEEFFIKNGRPVIDILVDFQSSFLVLHSADAGDFERGVQVLKRLDVPVLKAISLYHKTREEWDRDEHGLHTGASWAVVMPEFDGIIEPMVTGAQKRTIEEGATVEWYEPIPERLEHFVNRLCKWISLKKKAAPQRKIAFILHNKPCAGVEATVGAASNLDALESVARIMQRMKSAGYNIEAPESGESLIGEIMEKKAISEFRWTPVEEIVKRGGALKLLTAEEYKKWFDRLPPGVKSQITESWGAPPGAAMVYKDNIVITGVEYKNAVVCVQPKRGCYGARCDGEVCKILHDPDIPPTHQYLATYWYLEREWNADVIVHVGTHGNLEFLPGKAVGLSEICYPDICIGTLPHVYLYSVDNPAEGAIAKRRSYATLVDYMTPVMTSSDTYGILQELEGLLIDYDMVKKTDPARAHALEHVIIQKIEEANLKVTHEGDFSSIVKTAHEEIWSIKDSLINKGLHIFAETPRGDEKVELITSMLKHDTTLSARKIFLELMGIDYEYAKKHPDEYHQNNTYRAWIEEADALTREFVKLVLEGST